MNRSSEVASHLIYGLESRAMGDDIGPSLKPTCVASTALSSTCRDDSVTGVEKISRTNQQHANYFKNADW